MPSGGRVGVRSRSCRRSRSWSPSIAAIVCAARAANGGRPAEFPAAVAASAFGPRLQAAVRHADRAQPRLAPRHVGARPRAVRRSELSVGAVDAICQRGSTALAEPHQALVSWVLGAPAVNVDETGWTTAGTARTLWTATIPAAAIFRIAADRHRDRLTELLGERFAGICCSDRWWAYNHIDPESRQACWSHLQRDFRFHAEGLPTQKAFGEQGLALTSRLFHAWHDYRDHQDRGRLQAEIDADQDRAPRHCSKKPDARPRRTSTTAASPTTSSRSGPRSGRSSPSKASSRPTTPPNDHSADPSSTANSPTAPAAKTANTSSNAPSPPRSPAASNTARSSPTSPTYSPPKPAAIHSPRSPEPGGVNGYIFLSFERGRLHWPRRGRLKWPHLPSGFCLSVHS